MRVAPRALTTMLATAGLLASSLLLVPPAGADTSPSPSAPSSPTTSPSPPALTVPSAPSITDVAGGSASGQLRVTYLAPASDGGAPVTAYEVSVTGGTDWWPCADTSGVCTLTNLTNGTKYTVALRAVNAAGPGAASQPRSGVPNAPDPAKPSTLPKPRVWANATFDAASNGLGVDWTRTKLGVGTLPRITFTRAIPNKAVAEERLTVTKVLEDGRVKKVAGAWGWISDRSAVFRPETYWPGKATIMVTSTLDGAVLGRSGKDYVVGSRDLAKTWTFRTARKLVAKVDGAKVRMNVFVDGKLARTIPVSLGKSAWETRNGVKVISTQKEAFKTYTSTSLGLGPEEAYELDAPWNTRLTPTGEFIHTASWAYGRIGRYNGSHGCTNMYESDAKWIFDKTIPGDVVIYSNTGGTPVQSWNGPGGLWNIPWDQWLKKSALKNGSAVDTSDASSSSGGVQQEASA